MPFEFDSAIAVDCESKGLRISGSVLELACSPTIEGKAKPFLRLEELGPLDRGSK
jgi:hypothetical protein